MKSLNNNFFILASAIVSAKSFLVVADSRAEELRKDFY